MKSVLFLLLFVATTSYGQLARGKCKFLGSAIRNSLPVEFPNYWNQVTLETGGNWGDVEQTRDVMNWSRLDMAYNSAKDRDMLFTQHALVWSQDQPGWLAALSPQEQREEVEEWIKAFGERYPDADYIEVVNEPLHGIPAYAEALGGAGETGWDWVIWTFEKARQYSPNSKLLLNDYNIISNFDATDDYIEIIKILQERDLIDYIGEQGHYLEDVIGFTISDNLDKLALTDLPIIITAYDLNLIGHKQQWTRFQMQFPVLWEHPAIHGITYWGYRQFETMQKSSYLFITQFGANTERLSLEWLRTYVTASNGGTFCITGVDEEAGKPDNFTVYPNPSKGHFTIDTRSDFVVRDVMGKVLTRGSGQTSLQLGPGLYLIQSAGSVKKLVVE